MRQRQVAHIAAPCNPHQTLGYQTAAQALRVAAASIAARPAPWCRAARGFSAQAATEAPEHDVDLHVTDAAVEVGPWTPAQPLASCFTALRNQAEPGRTPACSYLRRLLPSSQRLDELAADTLGQPLVLRLTVEGGGCSGFTYLFDLENSPADDDR